jgi:hypothetical protein
LFDRREERNQPLTGDDAILLSDLEKDPGEIKNLRHRHPAAVDEMATIVQSWRDSLKSATPG